MKRLYLVIMMGTLVVAACNKKNDVIPCPPPSEDNALLEDKAMTDGAMNSDNDFQRRNQTQRLHFKTVFELLQVRAATARYRNIENADRDGYKTINVVMQNMGYHFMRAQNLDEKFQVTKPEILVYNKRRNGKYELVAVEYAVPLDKSVNAPQGFTGNADVWKRDTGFGLWLLHAWVWQFNPAGVFNPTNPNVIVKDLPMEPMDM